VGKRKIRGNGWVNKSRLTEVDYEALYFALYNPKNKTRKMMKDYPREFVTVIIQGESFRHERTPKERRRGRPIVRGFDSDVPDDDDI